MKTQGKISMNMLLFSVTASVLLSPYWNKALNELIAQSKIKIKKTNLKKT